MSTANERSQPRLPTTPSGDSFVGQTESVEIDLQCDCEHWATVHTLSWVTDGHGHITHTECTCNNCPVGAHTRPWPSSLELQDAGAPSNVPRCAVEKPSEKAFSLFG
jgi:hypothetical protein